MYILDDTFLRKPTKFLCVNDTIINVKDRQTFIDISLRMYETLFNITPEYEK